MRQVDAGARNAVIPASTAFRPPPGRRSLRYLTGPALVLAAFLLRAWLSEKVGRLPPFIFFYPVVMLVALLQGFYAGLFATLLASLLAAYFILPPPSQWLIDKVPDLVALVLFCAAGVFMSAVASLYRSARRRAAALEESIALGETRDRLHLALVAASAGAWEWDLRTNENIWSEELWKIYGLEPHSRTPSFEVWRETIVPEDRARVEQAVQEAAHQGLELNAEWRVRDPGGEERWLMSRGQPVKNALGGVTRYVGIVLDVTKRKRAEEALRSSEERLRLFVEHAPAAVAMFDTEMRYLAYSQRFVSDYRLQEKEFLGRSHYEVFPEIPERWREIHRRCLAGAVESCEEDPFPRADGSLDYIRWELRPWRNAANQIGGLILLSEIVTERKLILEKLADERERLDVTLRSIGDAVMATDEKARITVLNPVAEGLTGWRSDEAMGRPLAEVFRIVNEDTGEPAVNPAERVLREGTVVGLANHTALVARDGTARPIADSGAPIRDRDGQLRGVVLVFRDQTEERAALRALHVSEARYRAIFEQAALGAARVDTHSSRFLEVNARLCSMLGYSSEELLARTWPEITYPDDLPDNRAGVRQMEMSGEPYRSEKRYLRKDGSVLWGRLTVSPVLVPGEDLASQVAIVEDVTERKQSEQALAAAERWHEYLLKVTDAVRTLADPFAIQGEAARVLGETLRASRVHYAEVIEEGRAVIVHSDYTDGLPSVVGRYRLDDYGPGVMNDFRAGRTLVVPNVLADPRLSPAERAATLALDIEAYVMLPLMKAGRVVAVLVVHQSEPRAWTGADLSLIEETAERTWSAVERARVEVALRESEERYRLLADHAHDVIWTFELESARFTYVSPSVKSLRGLTVEEALAQPLEASLTEESLARARRLLAAIGTPAEEDPHTGIYDQLCKDGSVKHVEITVSIVRDASGRAVELLGVSRDATARVRAEQAVEDRERDLRTVLETALDGFWLLDEHGQILEANQAYCAMTGYSRRELLGMHIADLEAAETQEETAAHVRRIIEVGSDRFESRHLCKDGRSVEVEAAVNFVPRTRQFVCFFRDITGRKHADQAIRRNEERFRALIEKSSDMILVLDGEGRYQFWSRSAAEVLGWTAEEKVGQSALDLVHPDDRPRIAQVLEKILAIPGGASRDVLRYQHKDGTYRSIEAMARNLTHDPSVQGIVINGRDVTTQRQLEEQFQQAQKLESVGRLAGGVAHDFNNLLTVILSCSATLREDLNEGAPPCLEDVEEIHAAGERARDLTRQLLAFARKQVIAPVSLDLNEVVRGSQKMLGRLLGEDIDLKVTFQPGLWATRADPGQLEQVILNLAVNARDAMPKGGSLAIETRNVTTAPAQGDLDSDHVPGDWVQLVVRDSGSGMTPEVRAHLFEPFFTTKERGRGTGLGLATVYGIVKQSGGRIQVESEPGRGSTFALSFPRAPRAQPASSPEARPPAEGGTETILVVEDDVQVRAIIARGLRGAGYRVLLATSGADALDLFEKEPGPVDLVLTDVVMPGLGGRDLVEELSHRRSGLKVLYVSGYTHDVISHHGVLDSGVELLPKPFTTTALLARVRAVLDKP